jgi:hypothetical protein
MLKKTEEYKGFRPVESPTNECTDCAFLRSPYCGQVECFENEFPHGHPLRGKYIIWVKA